MAGARDALQLDDTTVENEAGALFSILRGHPLVPLVPRRSHAGVQSRSRAVTQSCSNAGMQACSHAVSQSLQVMQAFREAPCRF
eukprot:1066013-Prorocentrum_minimum.AAC.1